jgi:hypothetical protein
VEQACCPAQTCCAKGQAVTVQHVVAFTKDKQIVTFEPVDAGALESGAQLDAGAALDAAGDDVPMSGTFDTSELLDAAMDAALDDGGAALDVLVDI